MGRYISPLSLVPLPNGHFSPFPQNSSSMLRLFLRDAERRKGRRAACLVPDPPSSSCYAHAPPSLRADPGVTRCGENTDQERGSLALPLPGLQTALLSAGRVRTLTPREPCRRIPQAALFPSPAPSVPSQLLHCLLRGGKIVAPHHSSLPPLS